MRKVREWKSKNNNQSEQRQMTTEPTIVTINNTQKIYVRVVPMKDQNTPGAIQPGSLTFEVMSGDGSLGLDLNNLGAYLISGSNVGETRIKVTAIPFGGGAPIEGEIVLEVVDSGTSMPTDPTPIATYFGYQFDTPVNKITGM